jgi:diadenosine tetraphosphate (Ap4A) HIT family hydrolase
MDSAFTLDPRLAGDSLPVGDLALSSVLLLNDSRFPWFVLVPRRGAVSELTDLSDQDAAALMDEIRIATRVMLDLAKPDKVNVAAIGNIVSQLHVHVIARRRDDASWPKPVWGAVPPKAYAPGEGEALAAKLASRLK